MSICNRKCATKITFLTEKKNGKIQITFDVEI